MSEQCFIPFTGSIDYELIPSELNNPFALITPEVCKIAAEQLQDYLLKNQLKWKHNFGFSEHKNNLVKGKMFGVLVVQSKQGEPGFLATFSGKIQDDPHPKIFVPSVFDVSSDDFFINKGMTALTEIGVRIKALKEEGSKESLTEAKRLKEVRRHNSVSLQKQLFDNYKFENREGTVKNLCDIFTEYDGRNPAAGAGECAAPKLLQYAFEHEMKPLAIAEFWWGKSTKSEDRKHKEFYPACNDKCRPILSFMLGQRF